MRKITLLWIFLLQGILVAWAQEKTSMLPVNELKEILLGVPQKKVPDIPKEAATNIPHQVRSSAPVSIADYAGTYIQIGEDSNGTETGYAVETKVVNDTTLSITNFWNGGKTIKAIISPTEGTIKINPQEIAVHQTYGSIFIYSFDFGTNTYNSKVPVRGTLKDGVITLDSWIALINEGDYKSYSLAIFRGSEFNMPNAGMTETILEPDGKQTTQDYPIFLKQTNSNTLALYNASNIGVKINIQLNANRTIAIAPQTFTNNSVYGKFNCYPLKSVSATNPQFYTDRMITGKGTSEDLSWKDWGIYCDKAGIAAMLYVSSEVTTSLGITYPKAAEANFEGKGTQNEPFLIKKMEDLYNLSEIVNSDKTLVNGHTMTYTGKFFRLENDLDANTLNTTFHPIGYNETQRFAGTFDGNNKTIKNLRMNEGMGYCALFGYLDTVAVVKNLKLKDYICRTLGNYAGGIAGYTCGRIENCHIEGIMVCEGTYTGGIAGYSYGPDILDCSFKGTINAGAYVGGIVGTSFGNIKRCWANATINFASIKSYVTCGGITSSMFGTKFPDVELTDCYFIGRINVSNDECTAGGIAGTTSMTKILRCFSAAMIDGTKPTVNMGGILGTFVKTTIRDCYNSGMVANINSIRVGGLLGMSLNLVEGDYTIIENCYNSGLVYTASKEDARYILGLTHPKVTIKNCFYDQQMIPVSSAVYGLSTAQLTAVEGIKGFDPTIWNFTAGHYPRLKGIDNNNAAYLSSACMQLDKSSTTAEVRKNFTMTTDNQMDWKILMNNTTFGKVGHGITIEGNEAKLNGTVVLDTLFAFNAEENYKYYVLSVSPILWKGEGTAEEPFLIENKKDMLNLCTATNEAKQTFEKSFFKMTADIDMEYDETFIGLSIDNTGKQRFEGSFDGAGHTISKLKITSVLFDANNKMTSKSCKNTGLFGTIGEKGVVKNLKIAADCEFNLYTNGGAIAGYNYGLIENCKNYATVKGYMDCNGGIVGYIANTGIVRNCFNAGAIYGGRQSIGGIAGANYGTIETSQNAGPVSGVELSASYLSGTQDTAGGIAGLNGGGTILNSINTGKVSCYKWVGGIAGKTQKISGTGGNMINVVNYGKVEMSIDRSTTGQIIGYDMGGSTTTNSYYDIQLQTLSAVNNSTKEGTNGLKSKDLITGRIALPDSAWIQKENTYPMLACLKEEPKAILDSRAVVALDDVSLISNIRKDGAKLLNKSEVQWKLLQKKYFTIEEDLLKVTLPTTEIAADTLVATYNQVTRIIPIMALYSILEGKGTQEEPWLIKSTTDMDKLADFVKTTQFEYKGESFKVMEDLDFTGLNYTPVAFDNVIFQGNFDGNGKTIKNITFSTGEQKDIKERGLFGVVGPDGAIANLILSNCSFQTVQRCGAFVGGLYGKIINCVNDQTSVSTIGNSHAGGIAGFGYLGASIKKCKNNGTITSGSVYAGGILGGTDLDQTVKIDSCENSGSINVASSNAGGIMGRGAAYITNCHNTADITVSSSNAAGIVSNLLKGSYINNCYNTANMVGNVTVGGIVAGSENHTADAQLIIENCYNTGAISTTYSLKSQTNAGGIAGKIGNATIIRNCYNKGEIVTTTTFAGGIVGGSTATEKEPSSIENCYNTKEATVTANTNYAGGIIGNALFTNILGSYNEANVVAGGTAAANFVGGIAGNHSGRLEKSWNSGKVSAEYGMAGGIAGNGGTIDRCYNRGEVVSLGIVDKKSVSVGGILGKGNQPVTNCYNLGKVSGLSEVGGIIGSMVAGSKTQLGTVITSCYNLGEITATSKDSIGNIIGLPANFTQISASFYDKTLCPIFALDTCATALTTPEMVGAELGEAYNYGVATYPRIDAFEKDSIANFYATLVLFAEGDKQDDVKKNFLIGTPGGVKWTATSNLLITDNVVSSKNSVVGEEATLTLTAGELQRVYTLILNNKPDGIENTEAGKTIVSRAYYTINGMKIAEPIKGQIIIEKRIYDDGTSGIVKVLVEE